MMDDDIDVIDNEDENEDQQKPARRAPVQADARSIARELLAQSGVGSSVSMREGAIADIIKHGGDQGAVGRLLNLMNAERVEMHQTYERQRFFNHLDSCWNMFTDKLDRIEEGLDDNSAKLMRMARQGLEEDLWKKFQKDFPEELDRINNLQKPKSGAVSQTVRKVMDGFYKTAGITKQTASASLRSSKPEPSPSVTAAGASNLDSVQLKYFNAMKKELGPEKALERARSLKGYSAS